MEFKGTRGTWVLIKNDICSQEKIISTALGFIVEGKYTINEETKANALLISKSLEMLDFINRISGEMLRNDFVLGENWYKSREEIKREKQQKRRTLATIIIVYVIVCVAILLMNYFDR